MLRKAKDPTPGRPPSRMASSGLLVAVGTGIGNVLAYGFNLVLSRGLGPGGYAELGTLLSVFLIGSVPGMAVQAVNARRLATAVDGPPEALSELCRRLQLRGLIAGCAVAVVFLVLSKGISTVLPAVTATGVAWTGVSLAANTVFGSYLGIAQGVSRFATLTALYLTAHTTRLAIGIVAAHEGASPSMVMAAQTGAWAFAAIVGHLLLRDLARLPVHEPMPATSIPSPRLEVVGNPARPINGYIAELLRASAGLGGILLLANLDVLLAGRYLVDGDLGRYNTGALLARAAFFGPQFITILAYPRLARPDQRRRALLMALALTSAVGTVAVAITAVAGHPLVKTAFGAKYSSSSGDGSHFDLGTHAWLFTAVGALLAVVQLALLDGVARRSHLVSAVVLGAIVVETVAIAGFAHGSPAAIVTAAATCAAVTAAVTVTMCLTARVQATSKTGAAVGDRVGALPQTG